MKRFLTLIAVTAALATMAVPAFAQGAGPGGQKPGGGIQGGQRGPGGPGGPGGMGRERMQKMRAELLAKLNLSADQKTKIAALDKSKTYIVHCQGGGRSGRSMPAFDEAKFQNILHLQSGFKGWQAAGQPVEK